MSNSKSFVLSIFDSVFVGNTAQQQGGAVYTTGASTLQIQNNTFRSNSAHFGGSIYIVDSIAFTSDQTEISSSSAIGDGGGLYLAGQIQTVDMQRINFSHCSSSEGKGGAINFEASGLPFIMSEGISYDIRITDSHFSQNTAKLSGGALSARLHGVYLIVKFSQFRYNHASNDVGDNIFYQYLLSS